MFTTAIVRSPNVGKKLVDCVQQDVCIWVGVIGHRILTKKRDLCAHRNELTVPVLRLLKCGGEGIVRSAEILPFWSDNNRFGSINHPIRVLGEDNRKSCLEMPLSSEKHQLGRG